jgi:hypothetical protein
MINNVKEWSDIAAKALVGRKIVDARYMNDEEMEMMYWHSRPLCFVLDDGTKCILSMDDEGNDGGVLFYGERGVFPTL